MTDLYAFLPYHTKISHNFCRPKEFTIEMKGVGDDLALWGEEMWTLQLFIYWKHCDKKLVINDCWQQAYSLNFISLIKIKQWDNKKLLASKDSTVNMNTPVEKKLKNNNLILQWWSHLGIKRSWKVNDAFD